MAGEEKSAASGDSVADLFDSGEDDADESIQTAEPRDDRPTPDWNDNRLSTGLEPLDRYLGGGIPPGRIVSYIAPADTQSELLVKHIVAEHDCLYVSTLRPKWEVEEDVTDHVQSAGGDDAGSVRIEQFGDDARLDDLRQYVEEIEGPSILVIDAVDELEALEKPRYVRFIDDVKEALWETKSAGLFYGIEAEQPPEGRAVTLRRADLVWRLRRTETRRTGRYDLEIAKFRGGRALMEPVRLQLADEVQVDLEPGGG